MKPWLKTRAVFKEPQGFHEERPLTKLAKDLMPTLRVSEIVDTGVKYEENGDKNIYQVKLHGLPWDKEGKGEFYRGVSKDELEAFIKIKETWRRKGYKFD